MLRKKRCASEKTNERDWAASAKGAELLPRCADKNRRFCSPEGSFAWLPEFPSTSCPALPKSFLEVGILALTTKGSGFLLFLISSSLQSPLTSDLRRALQPLHRGRGPFPAARTAARLPRTALSADTTRPAPPVTRHRLTPSPARPFSPSGAISEAAARRPRTPEQAGEL